MMTHPLQISTGPWRQTLLLAACGLGPLLAGCGDKAPHEQASQTAARVNKQEITVHQINDVLEQQRLLRPAQAEVVGQQALEKLIDQELAAQEAVDQLLDRDPRIVRQLQAARREILARAYADSVVSSVNRPTVDEIHRYYTEQPALFKDRRVYNVQELTIEAPSDQAPALRTRLAAAQSITEFAQHLKASGYRFTGTQALRPSEQLPLASLPAFARLQDGQSLLIDNGASLQVLVRIGAVSQPVSEEQARPAIEQFILNERKRQWVATKLAALRANAKLVYVGKFAAAASAPVAATAAASSSTAAVEPPAAATANLTAADISKGMGLK